MNLDLVSRLIVDASQFDRVLTIAEGRLVGFAAHAAAAGNPASAAVAGAAASVLEGVRKTADLALGAINAVGNATTNLVKESVAAAAQFERTRTTFEVMLGSREKAVGLLTDLENLAIKTPFQTADLTRGAQMLMGADVKQDQIIPTLSRVGDIAGGDAGKLQSLLLAYSQATGTGRLMGGELMQFRNAGLYDKDFADTMGVSVQRFKSEMESGNVGIDVLVNTINRLTNEGGKFFDNNARQSKTLLGSWNALTETVDKFKRKLGEGISERFDLAGRVAAAADRLEPLAEKYLPAVYDWLGKAAGVLDSWLPAGDSIQEKLEAAGGYVYDMLPPMGQVKTLLEQAAGAARQVFEWIVRWSPAVAEAVTKIPDLAGGLAGGPKSLAGALEKAFPTVDPATGKFTDTWQGRSERWLRGSWLGGVMGYRLTPGGNPANEFPAGGAPPAGPAGVPFDPRLPPDLAARWARGWRPVEGTADAARYYEAVGGPARGPAAPGPEKVLSDPDFLKKLPPDLAARYMRGWRPTEGTADAGRFYDSIARSGAAGAPAAAGGGTGVPDIFRAQEASAKAQAAANDLVKKMTEGVDAFSKFNVGAGRLDEARRFGLLDDRQFREGRFEQYQQLRAGAGDYFRNLETPAPLALAGSTQAQDLVNKAMLQTRDVQGEVLQTLKAAEESAKAREEYLSKVNDTLNKINEGKLVVTRKGT